MTRDRRKNIKEYNDYRPSGRKLDFRSSAKARRQRIVKMQLAAIGLIIMMMLCFVGYIGAKLITGGSYKVEKKTAAIQSNAAELSDEVELGKSMREQAELGAAGNKAETAETAETGEVAGAAAETATEAAPEDDSWKLVLVNRENEAPEGFCKEFTELSNGQKVDSRIYPELQKMFDDMRAEGISPCVSSGYRSREEQEAIMQEKIAALEAEGMSYEDAQAEAKNWVADPGHSEHELGLALDINAAVEPDSEVDAAAANEQVYQWLADNAYKYGFILRYPSGREDVTGYSNEAWHYRYVGAEAAQEIQDSGLTLEEYLGR